MNFAISRCARLTTSRLSNIARILITICAAVCLLALPASAQTGHSAVISWAAPSDATAASTYNVYRAAGACSTTGLNIPSFSQINPAPVTALTYTDSTITVGSWCYYVTQVDNGAESIPSNSAGGSVLPNAPAITVTVK